MPVTLQSRRTPAKRSRDPIRIRHGADDTIKAIAVTTSPKLTTLDGFDYGALDSVVVEKIRSIALHFEHGDRKSLIAIVERGNQLRFVKQEMPGKFCRWLKSVLRWSGKSPWNYMNAANWLSPHFAIIANLRIHPTAAYQLVAAWVPDEARAEALALAQRRKEITTDFAREIIAEVCTRLGIPIKFPTDPPLRREFAKLFEKCRTRWQSKKLQLLENQVLAEVDSLTRAERNGKGDDR